MWNSEMFTEDQMVAWENKTMDQQTWAALQTYFTDKWLERKQYSATTAKQSRFKEAVLLAQETATAKEEGESQAMLFTMLQEQHDKQITAMTATNKANMDAMMERMNALVTGKGNDRCKVPSQQSATGQGKYPSRQHKPAQETQEGNSPLSPLQKIGPPQIRELSRAQGEQGQALARLEVGQYQQPTLDRDRGHEQ